MNRHGNSGYIGKDKRTAKAGVYGLKKHYLERLGGNFTAPPGLAPKQPDEIDDLGFWLDSTYNTLDGTDYMWTDNGTTVTTDFGGCPAPAPGTGAVCGRAVRWTARAGSTLTSGYVYWTSHGVAGGNAPPWYSSGGENNMPYLSFVEREQYFRTVYGVGVPYILEGTCFVVMQPTVTSGSNLYILRNSSTGQYNMNQFSTGFRTRWGMSGYITAENAFPDTSFCVMSGTFDGVTPPKWRRNGGAPLTYTSHSETIDSNYPLLGTAGGAVGAMALGGGVASRMNLYHVFVYDRVLTDTELNQIGKWLQNVYGVEQAAVTS